MQRDCIRFRPLPDGRGSVTQWPRLSRWYAQEMSAQPDVVTVYRSMDTTAKEDCEAIKDILSAEGLSAVILDDDVPGVPEGTYEIRVPAGEAQRAEKLIAENPLPGEVELDNSAKLDLVSIFQSDGSDPTGQMEAMDIFNVLETNGIAAVLVGDARLPNLPFGVRVAREQVERARELIAEAQSVGPAGAEEAELESEEKATGGS